MERLTNGSVPVETGGLPLGGCGGLPPDETLSPGGCGGLPPGGLPPDELQVMKRDGSVEILSFDKILKRVMPRH